MTYIITYLDFTILDSWDGMAWQSCSATATIREIGSYIRDAKDGLIKILSVSAMDDSDRITPIYSFTNPWIALECPEDLQITGL